jgi:hypothetical protein
VIPEHRQAIHGRTWDREWEPRAVEVYRRPGRSIFGAALNVALAIALGIVMGLLLWAELGGLL